MPRRNSAAYYPSGSWPLKLASATAQRGRAEFLPSATTLSSRQVWVWPCLVLPCQEVMDAHGTALPPQGWAPAHVLCRQKTFCLWQCKLQNEAGLCHSPVWFGCQQSEKSSLEIAVLTTGRRFCVTVELIHFNLSLFLSFFLLSSIFDVCSGVEHYVRYHLLLHTSCLPVFVQLFWAQVLISKRDSGVKWRNKSSNFKLGAALDIICWFKASLVQP